MNFGKNKIALAKATAVPTVYRVRKEDFKRHF